MRIMVAVLTAIWGRNNRLFLHIGTVKLELCSWLHVANTNTKISVVEHGFYEHYNIYIYRAAGHSALFDKMFFDILFIFTKFVI